MRRPFDDGDQSINPTPESELKDDVSRLLAADPRPRANLLGCELDSLDMRESCERCLRLIDRGVPTQQVSVNVAKIVAMRSNPRLAKVIAGAGLVSADGQGVVWASRLLRDPVPERVAGIDLMKELLGAAAERGLRIFVLGAEQRTLDLAVARLAGLYPTLVLAGSHHGWFRDCESSSVVATVRDARPDILFVGMSSPRKELWSAEHLDELAVPFVMGVGGSIDVIAGVTKRAPPWMQRWGFEWLYRVRQEPRRLWRRYFATNLTFAALLGREVVNVRLRGRSVASRQSQ